MRRIYAFVFLALLVPLAGCGALQTVGTVLSINAPNPITVQRQAQIHSAYDLFLAAAQQYWNGEDANRRPIPPGLPACRANGPSLCAKRSVVLPLQDAVRRADTAVRYMDRWVLENPTLNAASVIDAASAAIAAGQSILARK